MPRVHNFLLNYSSDPSNFVKKTIPSKNEYAAFFKEIKWNKKLSLIIQKEITSFKKEIKFNFFTNIFLVVFSLLSSLCIALAVTGVFNGSVTSENGIIIIGSIGSFLSFFIILPLFKLLTLFITYRTIFKKEKSNILLNHLLGKYLNNVQYLMYSKSPYTDFNFRLPGSHGRKYINSLEFDLIPRNFSIGLYKDELFPSNKGESWFYRKTNIWLTTLYYLAYVIENGNPYEKDDQTIFEIPGWMSETKWKEKKSRADEYLERYLKQNGVE